MGLLTLGGRPLDWGEDLMNKAIPHIKEHGVIQLINIWNQYKNDNNRPLLWGEEIEAVLSVVTDEGDDGGANNSSSSSSSATSAASSGSNNNNTNNQKTANLWLRAKEVNDHLNATVPELATWQPEYASFMVETVPKKPYDAARLADFVAVQDNMQARYDNLASAAQAVYEKEQQEKNNNQQNQNQNQNNSSIISKSNNNVKKRAVAVTLVSHPLLGVPGNFIEDGEQFETRGKYAKSLFIPDECTNQSHPRFSFLTQNIRLRRGRKVCIQIPMFLDKNTLRDTVDPEFSVDAHPNNKFIDCAPDMDKSRHTNAFSSSDDDEDEEDENEENEKNKNAKKKKNQKQQEATSATSATTASGAAGALVASNKEEQQHHKLSFQNHFRHLFTPSTHYFYAQYVNLAADKEAHVKERFNACPCPTPVREHPCVYMDSMCFGMGLNCLQVTMQWQNISEARHMYDQLVPIAPLLLALASATPFQKGILCDSDVRWLTISASVDCRHRGEVPRIIKSRYDNVSMYISDRTKHIDKYNDEHVEVNDEVLKKIKDAGCDDVLAQHFAHLFIRDPLVIFDQMIDVNDNETSVHFENLQSTNWQSMRFKPPPPDNSNIGWRTELRTMDIQLSAFENAAFSSFSVLLAAAIRKFNLFTIIPMALVSANMGAAHMRDPVKTQKFWWRANECSFTDKEPEASDFVQMNLDEIFNGCLRFEGLVPIVKRYILAENLGHHPRIDAYLELISKRASGKLKTAANFLREFVVSHPSYKQDSRLTREIAHDIVVIAEKLAKGDTGFDGFLPADLLQQAKRRRVRD